MHSSTQRSGRGRRPAAEVRAAAVDAAGRLLFAEGIRAITFERIAKEAGVSKTTLYKWWPSPGALAAEAYFARSQPLLEFPDTGDLHADLVTQVTSFAELIAEGGSVIPQLIGSAQTDPDLAEAWTRTYALPRRDLARERLLKAQRAGQLGADADIDIVIDQIWGAFYHRLLVLRTPIRDLDIERLVTAAIRGAG
ncbi:TetR/AcrR family transcriptional regulator [Microbacterium fluvii]|uniref:TetR/AcrR family transcriptional regulator n=1 Tax=Microbacterium fluvii TaxID=415215 RepID=A0ABW2HFI5_9MICO|nr:TetR/AcrR family transcriptional regulator [Microbacterium fluvii]MCU4671843.1 TetR/AcrR family transcriptional regulator [Microbacterium fluvii]